MSLAQRGASAGRSRGAPRAADEHPPAALAKHPQLWKSALVWAQCLPSVLGGGHALRSIPPALWPAGSCGGTLGDRHGPATPGAPASLARRGNRRVPAPPGHSANPPDATAGKRGRHSGRGRTASRPPRP